MSATYNPPPAWAHVPPVERAAHLFGTFEPSRAREICREEGIVNDEIREGVALAERKRTSQAFTEQVTGNSAFGAKA